ncbi:hypothetical protein TNCV_4803561 [Trichonephila clavipes]|nr:hypothetical protein TNCV_4803561 [Trichonephila clavipes]
MSRSEKQGDHDHDHKATEATKAEKLKNTGSERVAVQNGRVAVASDFCISCKCGIPLNSDNTAMKERSYIRINYS